MTHNRRTWISGHSGTGKTSLVQQVAARMNWPVLRVNFDSEISRLDLVGRDTLTKTVGEDGKMVTETKFVEGILPQALRGPYILLCDELDFVRSDIGYILQRTLEGEGLVLMESGGEIIQPHAMSRIVATANTKGQGDEHNIYQGARHQSLALLDRFTVWLEVEYLPKAQKKKVIKQHFPGLEDELYQFNL